MAQQFRKKWAMLIGVNGYENVTPLKFCRQDALDLRDTFQTRLGFEQDDILTFVEESEFPPQRNRIFHCLGQIKDNKNVSENDLFVFFFSGHGMIGEHDSKDYLLPIDASTHNLKHTGIKIEDIADELKDTGCKNIVMFIDACRELVAGTKGVVSIGEESSEALKRAGIVTFFSCKPKDKSYEIEDLKHGAFTHCILDAIDKGEGKTVSSLETYLRKQVPVITQTYKKPTQQPYAIIEPAEKKDLVIFFSSVQQKQVEENADYLLTRIGDLYYEGVLDDEYLNKAVDFLTEVKEKGSLEQETKRVILIKKLCANTLNVKAFKTAWEAHERKRVGSTGQNSLGPLT